MQFDIILSDQVWEHLDYPWRATRNVYNMLREGGWFYVCVPFYLKYHGAPHDCTRWTARGLHFLLEDCGFDSARITTGIVQMRATQRMILSLRSVFFVVDIIPT